MKTRTISVATVLVCLLVIAATILFLKRQKTVPPQTVLPPQVQPVDDAYWLNLERRRVDLYRKQLQTAPQLLLVRDTHYAFNSTNGMGQHFGFLDEKMANLHVTFSELVGYAYGHPYARTEFPADWTRGQLTNKFDVIVTITNRPREAMQEEARRFLRERFGLAWHRENRNTDVLVLRVVERKLLESKADVEFRNSKGIPELVSELENYFSMPVIDETGATNRYAKALGEVPARWVNDRTTDLAANNHFLRTFGLELAKAKRPQEWLVMKTVR